MDAARKHKRLLSQKQDFTTHNPVNTMNLVFTSVLPAPPSPVGVMQCVLGGCYSGTGFVSQLKSPKLRKHQSFIMGCKRMWSTFVPEGDIVFIILAIKQICFLLWRKTISVSHDVEILSVVLISESPCLKQCLAQQHLRIGEYNLGRRDVKLAIEYLESS